MKLEGSRMRVYMGNSSEVGKRREEKEKGNVKRESDFGWTQEGSRRQRGKQVGSFFRYSTYYLRLWLHSFT